VNEHIAAAVIGLDKAIASFSIEELDRTSHGHRETPPPYCCAATRFQRIGPTGNSPSESLAIGADQTANTDPPVKYLRPCHSAATIRGSGT
jgi:hypothetical protein